MIILLYISGFIYSNFIFWIIWNDKDIHNKSEKLLIFSTAIIPLGKLIYLPIEGFIGLKFTFIFAGFVSIMWIFTRSLNRRAIVLFMLLCVPIFSIIWLENPDWLFIYKYVEKSGFDQGFETGTRESVILRLIAFGALILYCVCVASAIIHNKKLLTLIARYYVLSTLAASIVGLFISIGIFNNSLSVDDLMPISVDVHIIEGTWNFYRFNPGANVNEFSMILAYALFLLFFVKWPAKYIFVISTFFLLCEFATLTRSSWVALFISFLIGVMVSGWNRKLIPKILFTVLITVFGLFLSYFNSNDVKILIDTRLAIDPGVSGIERLEKFSYVINSLNENFFRFLFGYGWSSNLYVHNVFLQLIYEIGILGLINFLIVKKLFFAGIFNMKQGPEKFFTFASIIFLFISALAHHTLYHVQTWLILGIVFSCISTSQKVNEKFIN